MSEAIKRDNCLAEIFSYLGLNDKTDGRLHIEADIMKKVIRLTSEWKIGNKDKWVDLLATRTCVSIRKIREDYVNPLISDGILSQSDGQGIIRFVGLLKNDSVFESATEYMKRRNKEKENLKDEG